jgi:hypothetical protein
MSIWLPSMYGVGSDMTADTPAGNPVAPIGPDLPSLDDWWFRGPATRALPPPVGAVTELVAGSSVTIEIACHVAWTSFGGRTTIPGSHLDACPDNTGMSGIGSLAGESLLLRPFPPTRSVSFW